MQDTIDMRNVERIPSLEERTTFRWSRLVKCLTPCSFSLKEICFNK